MKKKSTTSPIRDYIVFCHTLTDNVFTTGQRKLMKAHGTPKDFALACADAIGEISVAEAHKAALKYELEYRAA
jgi:hypothetical protein